MKYFYFLLFASITFAQTAGWQKNVIINHQGINRQFDVYIPQNLKKNPELLIQLHGGTQSKDEIYSNSGEAPKYWKEIADRESFLLIVPNGTNLKTGKSEGNTLNWNDCRMPLKDDKQADDVGFIAKIIDWSITNYQINEKKVFATGVSNGGFMSYRLALELPNRITAIAAFAANSPKDSECKLSGNSIPVMIVNGTEDKFIPFNGGITKFKNESILSSQETVDFWLKNNGLSNVKPVLVNFPNTNKKDKSSVTSYLYQEAEKKPVFYCIVKGGGHTMPGKKYVLSRFFQKIVGHQNQDIEGAELAWEFFKGISK
jgi:polyhydroxybutyrate depolymerase